MNLIDIGTRIYKRRREMGMTQEQLAEKMNVSIQMISNLERGNKAIRIDNLIKLCELLDVTTDFILLGRENASSSIEDFNKLTDRDKKIISQMIKFCNCN